LPGVQGRESDPAMTLLQDLDVWIFRHVIEARPPRIRATGIQTPARTGKMG
jgi:hypothetical protein